MELRSRLKVLVLLSLSIFLILFFVSPPFTGWIVSTLKIDVGISMTAQGCMYFINGTGDVYENEEKMFSIYLENCGNQVLNGNISLVISNSSGIVNETNSSNYTIDVFEYFIFNYTWIASHPVGEYTAVAKDNYTGETIEINTTFFINSTAPPPPPYVPPGPGGGAPSVQIRTLNFSVEVPDRVEIFKDANQVFLLKVTNNGEFTLNNVSLRISQRNVTFYTAPESAPMLLINSSLLFYVDIDATGIDLGEYHLVWEVTATGIKKTGIVTIAVIPTTLEKECSDSILYYLGVMDILKEQIDSAEREGKNVTRLRELFDETTYDLIAAQTFYRIESHQECIERVDVIKGNVKTMVIELARISPEAVILTLPVVYQMVIWSIVALVLILVLLFVLRWLIEYNKQRGRRLRLISPRRWT